MIIQGLSLSAGFTLTPPPAPPSGGGVLWVWGANYYGTLGDGTTIAKSSPVAISASAEWTSISTFYIGSLGIKTDGTLWTWGYGAGGERGDNTTIIAKSSPIQTISGGTNWSKVSGGSRHVAAIKTDGRLWMWGSGGQGGLGDLTTISKSSPVQTASGGTNWAEIGPGGTSGMISAGIKTDGTLWTWGYNNYGGLGNNTVGSSATDVSSPVQTAAGGTTWRYVSAGYHVVAIKTDGTLWTWGANNRGQLGTNNTTPRSSPAQIITGGTNWAQAQTGKGGWFPFTVALKTDGTLWGWGWNDQGQLGDNTVISKSSPVQTIAGGTNWSSFACGSTHIAAIKTDGTLWLWGENNGRLGTNDTAHRSSPVQTVAGGTNWSKVTASDVHTMAIRI